MRQNELLAFAIAFVLGLTLVLVLGSSRLGDGHPPGPVPPANAPPETATEFAEPPALPDATLVGAGRAGEGSPDGESEAATEAATEAGVPDAGAVPEPDEWRALDEDLREKQTDVQTREDIEATRIFVDFRGVPLADAARFIEVQTGIRVRVHPMTWEERTQEDVAVTVEAGTRSMSETLGLFRGRGRIYWWIEDGGVLLAPRLPTPEFVERTFPLGRLTDERKGPRWRYLDGDRFEARVGFEGDAICDIVRQRIDAAVWDEGGDVDFADEENALTVKAPLATQRRILTLLRKLARGEL